jgi:hypothetical protein
MGGFYLITANESADRRRQAMRSMDRTFRDQGLTPAEQIEFRGHLLQMFRKRVGNTGGETYRDPANPERIIAACGTLVVAGRTGPAALQYWISQRARTVDMELLGGYCLIDCDADGLHVRCDPLGLQMVFRNATGTIWSSSFLAVASTVSVRRFDTQGVYEYIFMEMPHGGTTVIEDVQLHDCRQVAHVRKSLQLETVQASQPPIGGVRSIASMTDECIAILRSSFRSFADAFSNRIDSGLSGGYDSRLILASLLAVGARPRLHVYGAANSRDVQVAKQLAARANVEIHHLDKVKQVHPTLEEYRAKAIEWLNAFDGYPADGIMGNGQDIESRMQRVANGAVPVNGGGGEILRNFFYLPDRQYTRRELLWTFYTQFDPATIRPGFSLDDYYRNIEKKVGDCVGHDRAQLTRREIEWLYSAFRCRFWMARNNSINNRFGAFLTPLFTWPLVKLGLDIPIQEKNHGRFESRLIRALAPDLAAVPSGYGHNFAGPIPLRRIVQDSLTLARPVWARRWSFTVQARLSKPSRPAWYPLAQQTISRNLPLMNRYFDVARIQHPGQLNRLYTLELLGQELGIA